MQEDFQTMLRAAGEPQTTKENIQNWLQLDEGDPGFQFVVFLQFLKNDCRVILLLFTFISIAYIIKFSICFLSFFCILMLSFIP
jgi:hypothetical protein